MRWVTLATALLLSLLLAGCGGTTTTTTTSTGTTGTLTTTGMVTTSTTTKAGHTADISAAVTTGTAPLNVTFGLASSADVKSWQVVYGDGAAPVKGDAPMPASSSHTYAIGGKFNATLTVTFKDAKTATDAIAIQVGVPDTGPAPPSHFDYGPASGCAGDVLQTTGVANCASFLAGPSQPPVDGYWQALDNRYWGKGVTSTVTPEVLGDTDCIFAAADEKTIVGDASNSDKACAGVVPNGTAWMFLYSYAEPEQTMSVDFAL